MRKNLTYGVSIEEGVVVSRMGSEIAWPVLDFKAIGQGGYSRASDTGKEYGPYYVYRDFNGPMRYNLEKFSVFSLTHETLMWTKKIPVEVKNFHRVFWGLKPLK